MINEIIKKEPCILNGFRCIVHFKRSSKKLKKLVKSMVTED